MSDIYGPARTRTSGWVIFAGVLAALAGFANLLYGITLLVNDKWVVLTPEALVTFDLTTVAIIYLGFGAFQIFVAMGIFNGDLWARVLGIVGASFGILAQLAFMSLYAQWSWAIIAIDALVIYGLSVHGDEVAEF